LVLVIGVGLLVEFVLALYYSPRAGLVAAILITLVSIRIPELVLQMGPLSVFPGDILAGGLLSAAVLRFVSKDADLRPAVPWIAVLALVAIAVARGAGQYGLEKAGLQARGTFHFAACIIYFATARPISIEFIERVWRIGSGVVILIAAAYWLNNGFMPDGAAVVHRRALTSAEGLLVVQWIVLALASLDQSRYKKMLMGAALVVLLLIQQRTNWIVLTACWFVLSQSSTVIDADVRRRARAIGIAAVLLLGILLIGGFSELSTAITNAAREPSRSDSTFGWRLEGWRELVGDQFRASPVSILIGSPSGKGFARQVDGQTITVAPHNFYIRGFLSIGLLGLGAMVWSFRCCIRRLCSRERDGPLLKPQPPRILMVLVLGQLLYFTTYEPSLAQGALFGLALNVATLWDSRKSESKTRVAV
jgi:hypothetical protein